MGFSMLCTATGAAPGLSTTVVSKRKAFQFAHHLSMSPRSPS